MLKKPNQIERKSMQEQLINFNGLIKIRSDSFLF